MAHAADDNGNDEPAGGVSFAEDETTTANNNVSFAHTDLFAAVEESIISCRPLVNFFYPNQSNNDDHDNNLTMRQRRDAICDIVRSSTFHKPRARRLFAGLTPLVRKISEEELYLLPDDDTTEADGNTVSASSTTQSILYLRCCAYLVEAYLDGIMSRSSSGRRSSGGGGGGQQQARRIEVIDEAFEVAEMLHDLLFPLQSSGGVVGGVNSKEAQQTQSAIFSMCEKWWHGNFEDREQMVIQLIPLLLVKSLEDTAQKNDVKRLYSIRDAINLLDFEDESIASLKLHLLRTVSNPLFLQSVEGRKFITHLFMVDAGFVVELHRAVRSQIVGTKKSILNAYAEIYYNAWKGSTEIDSSREDNNDDNDDGNNQETTATTGRMMIQTSIEENALQDFMYHVIHAAVPSTAKSVRVVLDKFYINKKSPDVEGMLHRMYGPLLWRALAGANSRVRLQASQVLSDTFPLRDPEAGKEWTEVCVTKSVEALISLMKDDVPNVRVAGSKATAKILSSFWAAVPIKDIRTLLNHIIAKHASDVRSATVRAAAVDAVTTLLEEDKTHAVLRPLLPSLGNLIHDKTEKVRLAVVNMLLFVKKIRDIKYYHLVGANHLLARLADEGRGRNNPCGPVAKGLSNLLSNSFFPTGSKKTMTDIINRTLRLLKDNHQAAVIFYRNASSHLSVKSISRLINALMKCLCYFVIEEKRMNCEDISNLSLVVEEDEPIECRVGGQSNTALMATIAESISILWESIETDLKDSQNENADEMLMDVFSGNVLTEVYCHFESKLETGDSGSNDTSMNQCHRACAAILSCAGKVNESKIEGLRSHIIGELTKSSDMPAKRRIKSNFCPNMALLCAWGMTEEVAECLASSISQFFSEDTAELGVSFTRKSDASKKRKQRGKQRAAAEETLPKLDIEVCFGILGQILKGSYPASVSARESILKSEKACGSLCTALKTAKGAAERMLRPRIGGGAEMSTTTIKYISICIECYGRLLIHKEVMKGEIPMMLTLELKNLATWAADTIVPLMVKLVDKDSRLRDLDLSSIMSVGSPVASPVTHNPSPIVDASFFSARGSNVFEDKAKFTSTRAAAISAMISVLRTFAEFITVRFVGDLFVSDQIAKICKLLESTDNVVRKGLLPELCHIAITSLKNEGDSTLFNEVLVHMKNVDPSPTEEETISFAVTTVRVLNRGDGRMLGAATSAIVSSIRAVVVEAEEESEFDMSFLDKVGRCMKTVLDCVLSEKQSVLFLAQCLIDEPKASSVRDCLLKELDLHAPKTDALNKILSQWAAENVSKDKTSSADDDKENNDANQLYPEQITA
ncbi:hypothetical protein ACHAXR_008448 [Thalassiosira sp. AJA248-18]